MIEISGLADAIAQAGREASSLASLRASPTSRAAVGILAERCQLYIADTVAARQMELYVCEDKAQAGLVLPSPFGIHCLASWQRGISPNPQEMLEEAVGILREKDMQGRPVVVVGLHETEPVSGLLGLSSVHFAPMSPAELVEVLSGHPPRTKLLRHVRVHTPLSLLNPYVYKGPVGTSMFFGRQQQLERLCELRASYALVGPRSIGKTSLMNQACNRLAADGELVIRTEHSPAMRDEEMAYQVVDQFVRHHGAPQVLLYRYSVARVERLIEDFATRRRRIVKIFIDEADELAASCPDYVRALRRCHNNGWARCVFLGYKHLRKAVSNAKDSIMWNIAQPMPLGGLSLREASPLVVERMVELGIEIVSPDEVARTIHFESGGSPSRIQLLCHFLVEELSHRGRRSLTVRDAQQAVHLPEVRKILGQWFHDSTTPFERWLAALACLYAPCAEEELVRVAHQDLPEATHQQIRDELSDLMTANVLDYRDDGNLALTFPALKELARPMGDARAAVTELRQMARQALRDPRE